jgi:nuclear transport factor 2 (NTF2) superfamily protein
METASKKARLAEDAWNSRDPARVALAYTPDSRWRNRAEFLQGRQEIQKFLTRSYGNENWEFDEAGLMRLRIASINDLPIGEVDRKFHWPLGRRPDDHPGLTHLGL